jgi:hypothetical protein
MVRSHVLYGVTYANDANSTYVITKSNTKVRLIQYLCIHASWFVPRNASSSIPQFEIIGTQSVSSSSLNIRVPHSARLGTDNCNDGNVVIGDAQSCGFLDLKLLKPSTLWPKS